MYVHILVSGCPTPLKNMSSSMGRIIPYMKWKIKNVPNPQPDIYIYITLYITYKPTYLHAFTNEIWGVNIGQTVT
jgi:hypothetical protein